MNEQMYTSWSDPAVASAALGFMTEWGTRVAPYSTGTAYQNYIDNEVLMLQTYYGDALGKLREVKGRYDPLNVFRFNQSIPLP